MSHRDFSLGTKLAAATVVVLAGVAFVVFYALAAGAERDMLASKRKAAELLMDVFAASAVAPLDFGDEKDVQNTLDNLRSNKDITYGALFREGTDHPVAGIGSLGALPRAPEIVRVAETRVLGDALEILRPILRPDGTPLGLAVIRVSLAPEYAELAKAKQGLLLATATAAGIVALLILGFARVQIVAPIERLVTAARRLESGQKVVRVKVESMDEVGRLGAAFNTMSDAIRDREKHLADAMTRLRELFDNMAQGIVVFGPDGVVEEAPSAQGRVLFGPDAPRRSIRDLLYGEAAEGSPARQAFEEWLACAFHVSQDEWKELASLAPKVVERNVGKERQWLELQFTPVVHRDMVTRIMLLATDVSNQKRLQRAAQTRDEEHEEQMQAMRRLVAGGGQVFASFLDAAQGRIAWDLSRLRGTNLDQATLAEIFQRVHTTRGEARTFGLRELSAECQGVERLLRELREEGGGLDGTRRMELSERLERAARAVERAREMFVEASPIGRAVLDQMTVRRSDVQRLSLLVEQGDDAVRRLVASLTSRPFGECLAALEAVAPFWAKEIGKEVRLVVEGRDARVPAKLAPALSSMLPHLVRNAIAHGIEEQATRKAAGKSPVGTVCVSAHDGNDALVVRVTDDGAGLDEAAIVRRARELGLPDAPASELVFAAGLSTLGDADELAGQGMGLAAARAGLGNVGCTIVVKSAWGRGIEVVMTALWTERS